MGTVFSQDNYMTLTKGSVILAVGSPWDEVKKVVAVMPESFWKNLSPQLITILREKFNWLIYAYVPGVIKISGKINRNAYYEIIKAILGSD